MRHPRDEAPDPAEARRRYAELAATYERRSRLVRRFRIAAVRRLELQLGDHVLDLGCGTGASFPYLVSAVGSTGRVTGVDLSDEMAAVARARVTEAGWDNVDIIVSEAVTAPIPTQADGALFFLAHDLVRSPPVLEHVINACRPGAHIVAFGPKTAPRWNWPLNVAVRWGTKRYVTTFEGFDKPWSHLESLLEDSTVRSLALGAVYLGHGRVRADSPAS
jgi:demethylmenaquinone methyltransferase/2-methoxy-6-polyprenyl-1,4-benzoquinol methylase